MTRLSRRYEKKRRSKVKEKRKRIYKKIVEYRERVREAKRIAKKKRKPKQKKLPTDYEILKKEKDILDKRLSKMSKQLKAKRGDIKWMKIYNRLMKEYDDVEEELGKYKEYIHMTYVLSWNYENTYKKMPLRKVEFHITLLIPTELLGTDKKALFKKLYKEMITYDLEILRDSEYTEEHEKKWAPMEGWSIHGKYILNKTDTEYDFRYMDKDHPNRTRKDSGKVYSIEALKEKARQLL